MNINSIFETLKATSSKNDKLAILLKYKGTVIFKNVVEAALNPLKMYHIKKIPPYTPTKVTVTLEDALKTVLPALTQRTITGHAALKRLADVLAHMSPDDAAVFERVILKDLDCGVAASSVNKIWSGLIPEFPVMLCSPYDDKLVAKIKWPALAQLKADGMRFNAICKGGTIELCTRKGKTLDIHNVLDEQFGDAADSYDVVFDGELLVYDEQHKKILPRAIGNGILNKAIKGTITRAEAERITYKLWDVIDYNLWLLGADKTPYHKRLARLREAFDESFIVPTHEVNNLAETVVIFEDYLAQGQEGLILKEKNSPWEDKRSKWQIKMKGEYEADLECIGWAEGIKKNKGKLGALQLKTADGKLKVDCGSGLSDEQRATLKAKDVVGKIIAVKYNAKLQDSKGNWTLFLPIFVEVREDKTVANTFKELEG